MSEKLLFADADANFSDAVFIIFGAPFDGTSCCRMGSRLAPDAIREASYNFETYNRHFDIDLQDVPIHDLGNVEIHRDHTVEQAISAVASAVSMIVNNGKIPIMIGGEHSLTLPCIRALKNNFEDLGAVVLDAHLDLRAEYEGTIYSHACISRRIIEDVTRKYVSLGIRSGTKDEYALVEELSINSYSADHIQDKGMLQVLREITESFDAEYLYLSLDMDALDPAFAPALGSPEPFGLTDRDVLTVIRMLAPYSAGFDIVEIAPSFDSGNTAMLGAKYIREFISSAWASRT